MSDLSTPLSDAVFADYTDCLTDRLQSMPGGVDIPLPVTYGGASSTSGFTILNLHHCFLYAPSSPLLPVGSFYDEHQITDLQRLRVLEPFWTMIESRQVLL